MGIPKKKSRKIIVDGRAFRWMLKVDPSLSLGYPRTLSASEDGNTGNRTPIQRVRAACSAIELYSHGGRLSFHTQRGRLCHRMCTPTTFKPCCEA